MSEITEIYAHLTELRKRVLRIVIVIGIIAVWCGMAVARMSGRYL